MAVMVHGHCLSVICYQVMCSGSWKRLCESIQCRFSNRPVKNLWEITVPRYGFKARRLREQSRSHFFIVHGEVSMFLGKKIAFIRDNGEIDIQALLRNHPVYKYHDDQADQTHRRWYRLSFCRRFRFIRCITAYGRKLPVLAKGIPNLCKHVKQN